MEFADTEVDCDLPRRFHAQEECVFYVLNDIARSEQLPLGKAWRWQTRR